MRYEFTPDEAQHLANLMIKHLKKKGMLVRVEKRAWSEAPYITTLVAGRQGRLILTEVQGTLSYSKSLKDLVYWMSSRRH